jgi:predicted ArsR family transcriptional regulator
MTTEVKERDMSTTKRPRGRPRPQETIDRDNAVLAYLTEHGPQTRNALADALGQEKSRIWLSLDRLRRDGRVRLCGPQGGPEAIWTTEVSAPCP